MRYQKNLTLEENYERLCNAIELRQNEFLTYKQYQEALNIHREQTITNLELDLIAAQQYITELELKIKGA